MGIERLNDILEPVSEHLKSMRSHDELDHWLVQEMLFKEIEYFNATHVIIGCPQHEGVKRNKGRTGAAQAPNLIRKYLYKMQVHPGTPIKLFDAGNIRTAFFDASAETLEESLNPDQSDVLETIHSNLTKAVSKFVRDGKRVIVLGGGNDISYADVRALAEVKRDISAINIDAHLDMRKSSVMHSGTPYRRLVDEGLLEQASFFEFGIQPESNGARYIEDVLDQGVNVFYLEDIIKDGAKESFKEVLTCIEERAFFLGLDMDSIQAADAPGVSASSPIGLTAREVADILRMARAEESLHVFEITEVNPTYDIDHRTVKLAARLAYIFLFG